MAKNPMRPPRPLTADSDDFINYNGPLWRIYRTTGRYRQHWNDQRMFGPLKSARWDPQFLPTQDYPDNGVSYAAAKPVDCFAEVFQDRRAITLSAAQSLAGWLPVRGLRLLNLFPADPDTAAAKPSWAERNGAAASLTSARRDTCRSWAQAVRTTWPDIDGLYAPSTISNGPVVVLWQPAANTFPQAPSIARPLDHPALTAVIRDIANYLRWPIRAT